MLVTLVFVPPGGGEADYSLKFELPNVPRPGDYVSIMRPTAPGTEDFIVRRTWWHLDYPESPDVLIGEAGDAYWGSVRQLIVECEFAKGLTSGEGHRRNLQMYQTRQGKAPPEFEHTAF